MNAQLVELAQHYGAVSNLLATLKSDAGVSEAASVALSALSAQFALSSEALQFATQVDGATLAALRLTLASGDFGDDTDDYDELDDDAPSRPAVQQQQHHHHHVFHPAGAVPLPKHASDGSYDAPDSASDGAYAAYATMPITAPLLFASSSVSSGDAYAALPAGVVTEAVLKFEASVAALMSSVMNFSPASAASNPRASMHIYASRSLPTPAGRPEARGSAGDAPNSAAAAPKPPQPHQPQAPPPIPTSAPPSSTPQVPPSPNPLTLSPRRNRCERCGAFNGRTITPYAGESSATHGWTCLCLQCSFLLNGQQQQPAAQHVPPATPGPLLDDAYDSVPPLPPLPSDLSIANMGL